MEDTQVIDGEVIDEDQVKVEEPKRWKRIAIIAGSSVAGVLAITTAVIIKAKSGGSVVPE